MVSALVDLTGHGADASCNLGYTFSDLTQRLIPTAILEAFPDRPITGDLIIDIAQGMNPTPAFAEQTMPEIN